MQRILHSFCLISFVVMLSACSKQEARHFYTWQGIGPDKWAAVWLLNRHIDPQAKIEFVPVNGKLKKGIAFDIPEAKYKRTSEVSTIASLATTFLEKTDKSVNDVIQVIHDIEVISWGEHVHPRSYIAEIAFRDLQKQYGRDTVPPACYLSFFDNLQSALINDTQQRSVTDFQQALMPDNTCENQQMAFEQTEDKKQLVEEIPIADVLAMMKSGKQVVFVDAREKGEYDEFHIPEAVNLQLRKVSADVADQFTKADKVIAYCLKDFRGFELAKALKQKAGIQQVAIMNPYGINGWRAAGLPVAGERGLSVQAATEQLQYCVENPVMCLGDGYANYAKPEH